MIPVCRLWSHRWEIKSLGEIQGDQRCDSLSVRRAFPDVDAAVVDTDGFVPVGVVGGEVFRSKPAAFRLDKIGGLFCDFALVESFAPTLGDHLQGTTQFG